MLNPTSHFSPLPRLCSRDVINILRPVLLESFQSYEGVQRYALEQISLGMKRERYTSKTLAQFLRLNSNYVLRVVKGAEPVSDGFVSMVSLPLGLIADTEQSVVPLKRNLRSDKYVEVRDKVIGAREYGSEWGERDKKIDLIQSITLLVLDACFPKVELPFV